MCIDEVNLVAVTLRDLKWDGAKRDMPDEHTITGSTSTNLYIPTCTHKSNDPIHRIRLDSGLLVIK
jgi:hypothetical protein